MSPDGKKRRKTTTKQFHFQTRKIPAADFIINIYLTFLKHPRISVLEIQVLTQVVLLTEHEKNLSDEKL